MLCERMLNGKKVSSNGLSQEISNTSKNDMLKNWQ